MLLVSSTYGFHPSPLGFTQNTNHSGQLPSPLFSRPQCSLCFLTHPMFSPTVALPSNLFPGEPLETSFTQWNKSLLRPQPIMNTSFNPSAISVYWEEPSRVKAKALGLNLLHSDISRSLLTSNPIPYFRLRPSGCPTFFSSSCNNPIYLL